MNSINLIFFIISITCVILVINVNNKLETFKREKFDPPVQPQHISTESISNLSALATNIISNNGADLNLEFKNINLNSDNGNINLNTGTGGSVSIIAFKYMISPFYVHPEASEWKHHIETLKNSFWFLCDGNEVSGQLTPDLRGRFILGSGQGSNLTKRDVLATGGEENHTLLIGEMPKHTHDYQDSYLGRRGGMASGGYWTNKTDTKHSTETGSGGAHNNMPPYFVLAYFIYLPPSLP